MNKKLQIPLWVWKTMKISSLQLALIALCCGIAHAHKTNGQNVLERNVSIQAEDLRFMKVLSLIEEQANVRFIYSPSAIDIRQKVTVKVTNKKLENVLREFLLPLSVDFTVAGERILLKRAIPQPPRMNAREPDTSVLQENVDRTIRGKVTDEKGEPLPGVNILVKGSTRGTTTHADGTFLIDISGEDAILVFSFVGYLTQEVVCGNRRDVEVRLEVDHKNLEELVVVGYGSQKKANLTGAVSTVDSRVIENRPVSNLANALQGSVSGLNITRTNGQPGNEGINIQIRGATSANGNVNPLLVVDGVPSPLFTLQSLNPNDVASISVLKDAAASAIYGAQAAGGVILVTTKKGASGKISFDYSSLFTTDYALNVPSRLTLMEEAEYSNLGRENAGLSAEFSDADFEFIRNGIEYRINPSDTTRYIYYNQQDLMKQILRRTTPMQTHNFTARGGTENLNFLGSFGYYKKQGIFEMGPDRLTRYNSRLNVDARLTNYISFETQFSYTFLKEEQPPADPTNIFWKTYKLRTRDPIFTPEGRYASNLGEVYALLNEGGYNIRDRNFFDNVAKLKVANFVKGLELQAIYGVQYRRGDRDQFARTVPLWYRFTPRAYLNDPNSFALTREVSINHTLQLLADYDLQAGKNKIHLLGGYQFEDSRFSSLFSSASNLVSNDLPSMNLGDDRSKVNTQTINTHAYQSYFARISYSYADKYMIEATLRVDESSKLSPQLRKKSFPAFSAGWNLHRENWFFQNASVLSELKLRASWGQLGSALGSIIGNYDYMNLLSRNSNLVLGTPETRSTYFFQGTVPSSTLTWETVQTTNTGLELGLFKNKLQLSADYYVKYNRNMLTPLLLPATFGVGTPRINNGELKSWGWEVEMRHRNEINDRFSYSIGLNVFDTQNKLISYAGRKVISPGLVGILEDYPLNSVWGYLTDGYFQQPDEIAKWAFQDTRAGVGDVKYLDQDGDGRITAGMGRPENHGDLVYLGTNDPRYSFGVNGNIQWKGIDFSFFIQGVGKRSFYPDVNTIMPLSADWNMPSSVQRDHWSEDNRDARFPRPYIGGTHNYQYSDKWRLNGQYVRLKNMQMGYSLPESLLSRVNIKRARIFFTGQDFITLSRLGNFKELFDPESKQTAKDEYPFFGSLAIGLNLSF